MDKKIILNLFGGKSVVTFQDVQFYTVGFQGIRGCRMYYVNDYGWAAKSVWLYKSNLSSAEQFDKILSAISEYQIKIVDKAGVVSFSPICMDEVVIEYGSFYGVLRPYAVHSHRQADGCLTEPTMDYVVLTLGAGAVATDWDYNAKDPNLTEEIVPV